MGGVCKCVSPSEGGPPRAYKGLEEKDVPVGSVELLSERSHLDAEDPDGNPSNHIEFEPDQPEEDIYGMAAASLVIDTRRILLTTGQEECKHAFRLALSLMIVLFTCGLQIYFTYMTKYIVTPKAVAEIRLAYHEYEEYMYDNHTHLTVNGHDRGNQGFFNASKFETLNSKVQKKVCNFSLTQPVFLFFVLLVWTLTCLRYARKSMQFLFRFLIVPTVHSMSGPDVVRSEDPDEKGPKTVLGLTCWIKVFFALCIQLPCLCMNFVLLWIGSRWLVATMSFEDVLLNALALEFVLNLHELLYSAIVPHSMKQALSYVLIPHRVRKEAPSWCNMFGTFSVLIISAAWSYLYIYYFQCVLVDYRWDIVEQCKTHGMGLHTNYTKIRRAPVL